MNACWLEMLSMNGFITSFVAKLKINPNVMEMGNAGRAFFHMASRSSVRHKPYKKTNNNMRKLLSIPAVCKMTRL